MIILPHRRNAFRGFNPFTFGSPSLYVLPNSDPGFAAGGAASLVTDLSGNGIHFSQGTTAYQPTWTAGATPNGKAALTFDGSDDWLTAGDKMDLGLASRTIFIGFKRNSGNCGLLNKSLAAGAGGRWAGIIESGAATTFWTAGGTAYLSSGADTDTGWQLLTFVLNRSAGTLIRKNGIQIASNGSAESANNHNTTYALLMGAYNNNTDGLTPVAGYYLNGQIGLVLTYETAMTPGQASAVEVAVGAFLGITVTP